LITKKSKFLNIEFRVFDTSINEERKELRKRVTIKKYNLEGEEVHSVGLDQNWMPEDYLDRISQINLKE